MGLTNVPPYVVAPALYNYDECGRHLWAVADGQTVYKPCDLVKLPYTHVNVQIVVRIRIRVDVEIKVKLPYRYVIVQLEATGTILNFCEIEVYENGQFSLSFHHSNGGSVDALRPHKNVS